MYWCFLHNSVLNAVAFLAMFMHMQLRNSFPFWLYHFCWRCSALYIFMVCIFSPLRVLRRLANDWNVNKAGIFCYPGKICKPHCSLTECMWAFAMAANNDPRFANEQIFVITDISQCSRWATNKATKWPPTFDNSDETARTMRSQRTTEAKPCKRCFMLGLFYFRVPELCIWLHFKMSWLMHIWSEAKEPSRGFEPRSLDSGSRVLTVTPRGPADWMMTDAPWRQ